MLQFRMHFPAMAPTAMLPFAMLCTALLIITLPTKARASTWLKTGSETSRPYGHVEYCNKYGRDCRATNGGKLLPPARLSVLQRVNRIVNQTISPVSDMEQFGKREFWSFRTKAGDCEDYALAKRKKLMRKGFKASHLLLTMARWKGIAHTVLVVRTRQGDFVLDNLRDEVLPVNATDLAYVKMQSAFNSAHWLRITGKTGRLP